MLDVYYILTVTVDKTLRSGTLTYNGSTPINYQVQATQMNLVNGESQWWAFPSDLRFGSAGPANFISVQNTNGAFQTDVLGTGFGNGGSVLTAPSTSITFSIGAYVTGSYYNDVSLSVNTAQLNLASFDKYLYTTHWGSYAVDLATNLSKDSTKTFTVSARYSWNRT